MGTLRRRMTAIRFGTRHACLLASVALLVACARGNFDEGDSPVAERADDAGASSSSTSSGAKPMPKSDSGGSGTSGGADSLDSGSMTPPMPMGGTPRCVGLLINEVQTAGTTAQAEFVEVYNPGPDCSFQGWKLVYRSATGTTDVVLFDTTVTLTKQGYAVFGGSGYIGTKAGVMQGSLAGDKGQLQLRDQSASVSDSMGYGTTTGSFVRGSAAPVPPANQSIGRRPNGVTTLNNAADFKVLAAPSPGVANP
jgi:hypothetical protein